MSNIISARDDGLCAICASKKAVTNDRRFCKPCLSKLIRQETPDPSRQRGERFGRHQQVPGSFDDVSVRDAL